MTSIPDIPICGSSWSRGTDEGGEILTEKRIIIYNGRMRFRPQTDLVDDLPQAGELQTGYVTLPADAEMILQGIAEDLEHAGHLFVTEPVGGNPASYTEERDFIVTEPAPGKLAPYGAVMHLIDSVTRSYHELSIALGNHPKKEEILVGLHMDLIRIRSRLQVAKKITWWQERLSVFSYPAYRPDLDKLRKGRES